MLNQNQNSLIYYIRKPLPASGHSHRSIATTRNLTVTRWHTSIHGAVRNCTWARALERDSTCSDDCIIDPDTDEPTSSGSCVSALYIYELTVGTCGSGQITAIDDAVGHC